VARFQIEEIHNEKKAAIMSEDGSLTFGSCSDHEVDLGKFAFGIGKDNWWLVINGNGNCFIDGVLCRNDPLIFCAMRDWMATCIYPDKLPHRIYNFTGIAKEGAKLIWQQVGKDFLVVDFVDGKWRVFHKGVEFPSKDSVDKFGVFALWMGWFRRVVLLHLTEKDVVERKEQDRIEREKAKEPTYDQEQIMLAGLARGHGGIARLAFQLAGFPACKKCDFMRKKCKCPRTEEELIVLELDNGNMRFGAYEFKSKLDKALLERAEKG